MGLLLRNSCPCLEAALGVSPSFPEVIIYKASSSSIAVITIEPADKSCFVYNCMKTRLRGQYNGKWPISLVWVSRPLVTVITAIDISSFPFLWWNKFRSYLSMVEMKEGTPVEAEARKLFMVSWSVWLTTARSVWMLQPMMCCDDAKAIKFVIIHW